MADLKLLGVNYPTIPRQRQVDPVSDRLLFNTIGPSGGADGPLVVSPVAAVSGASAVFQVSNGSDVVLAVTGGGQVNFIPVSSGAHPAQWASVHSYGDTALDLQTVSTFLSETSPEGVISAPPGSICHVRYPSANANDGVWTKNTGTGTAGWVRVQAGVSAHSALTGLSNDDHPQYLLADGTRTLTGNLTVSPGVTIDGRDISTDGTKLDGIEIGADVTDFTNVQAAGALMENDFNVGYEGVLWTPGDGSTFIVLRNYVGAGTPTAFSDAGSGYGIGSTWIDEVSNTVYVCVDATVAAAVWVETSSPGVTDHGALTGLADDDHTQYLRADGTRALAGNLAVNALVTIDGRDISVDGATQDAHIASTANPHATSIANIGSGTLAQLNAAVSDADLVPAVRTVTAGTGLTGGGALSANITLNVAAHADGSIVVAADSVQVGILATDAQHGVRGGGTQHAVATGLSAGFMSSADKTALDGLVAGIDHGTLIGLADDDHVQYLLINGTRDMTGNFTPNADGTLDIGFDSEVDPRWWRNAYIDNILAGATETSTLTVSASANITEAFMSSGSLANPSLNFWGSGFYSPVNEVLTWTTGGADVLTLSSGGGTVTGNWIPSVDLTYNLGAPAQQWLNVYAGTITAGSITTTTPIDHGGLGGLADDDHTQYLLIDGTRAMTGKLRGIAGTAASPAFSVGAALNTGMYEHAPGYLAFGTGGTVRLLVSTAGVAAQGIVYVSGTSSLATPAFTFNGGSGYGLHFTGSATSLAAAGIEVLRAQAPAAANPQALFANGALATPSISLINSPTSGFYRYAADAIGVSLAGSAKFSFSGNYLYTNQSLGGLSSTATNNGIGILTVIGNAATGVGLLVTNNGTFSSATGGDQSHVEIRSTINQSGVNTSKFAGLKINLTNTALGTGGQYFIDAQVAGTTVAAITNGTTAATQGRVLAGYGATATPGIGWLGDDTVGLVRTGAGSMGVISQSSERWRFEGGTFYAMANGAAIRQNVANGSLILYGNITSATDDRAGIQIINVNNMSGASGSARHVMIENNVNQSGNAGYTVLDIVADELAVGIGDKYLLNAKAGAGGTSQKFAVKNDGSVLITNGTLTNAALGFLSNPDTGIINADALGAPGVPSMLFMVNGVFAGGFIDEASTGDVQFRTVSGTQAVPSLAIDQNDLGFYAPSGNQGAAVVDNVEVFRWEAPSSAPTFTVASAVKHTGIGIFPTIADMALGDSVASPFAAAQPWGFIYSKLFSSTEDGSATFPTFGWETYVGSGVGAGIYYNGAVAISDAGVQVANFNGVLTSSLGTVLDAMKFTPSISTSAAGSGYNAFVIDVAEPLATGTGAKSLLDLRYATAARFKVLTSGQVLAASGTAAAPTYSFSAAPSIGFYYDTVSGFMQFSEGATAILSFTADGITGVGNASVRMDEGSAGDPAYSDLTQAAGVFFGGGGDRLHLSVAGGDYVQLNASDSSFRPTDDSTLSLGAVGARWTDVHAITTTIGDLVMKDPHGGRPHLKLVEGEGTLHVYDVRNGKKYHVPLVEDEMTDADLAFIEAERTRWPEYSVE